jgi:hypothetical protein
MSTITAQDIIPKPKTKAERKAERKKMTLEQRIEDVLEHFIGLPYDNGFDLGDRKSMYCSELVYSVFEDLVDDPCFDPKYIAEMPFFTPDDVYSCGQLSWSIITK